MNHSFANIFFVVLSGILVTAAVVAGLLSEHMGTLPERIAKWRFSALMLVLLAIYFFLMSLIQ